ncbi:conserved hypothetical protein [Rippkaea orientalis PCC 8801]|uniref:Uncharacterized protein n=1 Tax=Rippkaea orientalis (strain PCC 8801 / RF-1) TaxID=41431 RepID=B7K1B4_RIPO1|nr:hypothetical protein [Rippkaea orientalis]ACK66309.1 conserved hypothetical protein [Rippkaea orientalis PCC 8801]
MTIIVKHSTTGNYYLLLGTGGGVDQNLISPRFLKNLLPIMVTVCDRNGNIFGLPASELVVTTLDGQPPSELLPEPEVIPPPPPFEPEVTQTTQQSEVEVFEDDDDEEWI